ncbi:hypothetical protein [Deinococcus roseus]|uniref:HIT domain-containing protein n=1 Tax=Deinococcus roseus TaxID=392414 RepID=A0ABQ2CZB6_9DEIO|nr:hypothetical protein [Deinococcus roseus]GGJ35456.1 hypothetical protein GCM10008938_21900 [Deinococcus roseus]
MARTWHHFHILPKPNSQPLWTTDTPKQRLQQITGLAEEVQNHEAGFAVRLNAERDVARLFLQLVKPHLPIHSGPGWAGREPLVLHKQASRHTFVIQEVRN